LQENNLSRGDPRKSLLGLSEEEQREEMSATPHCLKCSHFASPGLSGYCRKHYKEFVDNPTSKASGFMLQDDFIALMERCYAKERTVYYRVLHDEFNYRDPKDVPMHLRNEVAGMMARRIDLDPPFTVREKFDDFNQGRNFWGETFGDMNTKFGEER